jgi:hypothetical protein
MIKTGALRHGAKHRKAASRAALNADRRFYDPTPWLGFDVAMAVPPGFEALKEVMEEANRNLQEVIGMPAFMQANRPPTTGVEIQMRMVEARADLIRRAQDAADLAETGASQDQCDRVLTGELGVARIDARHT